MRLRVTAAQAAWLVGHGERMVRWHIQTRKDLPAVKDGRSWAIDIDDLARIPGWRINRDRLAELQAADAMTAASMAARLAELERTVRELRTRLARLEAQSGLSSPLTSDGAHAATLEGRQAALSGIGGMGLPAPLDLALSASEGHSIGLSPDARHILSDLSPRPRRAVPTMRLSSGLPDDLVSMAAFAAQHGIAETTVKKAAQSSRLHAIQGRWKHGRAYVSWALDADGRRAFYALWGDRPDFTRCAECPH